MKGFLFWFAIGLSLAFFGPIGIVALFVWLNHSLAQWRNHNARANQRIRVTRWP